LPLPPGPQAGQVPSRPGRVRGPATGPPRDDEGPARPPSPGDGAGPRGDRPGRHAPPPTRGPATARGDAASEGGGLRARLVAQGRRGTGDRGPARGGVPLRLARRSGRGLRRVRAPLLARWSLWLRPAVGALPFDRGVVVRVQRFLL